MMMMVMGFQVVLSLNDNTTCFSYIPPLALLLGVAPHRAPTTKQKDKQIHFQAHFCCVIHYYYYYYYHHYYYHQHC